MFILAIKKSRAIATLTALSLMLISVVTLVIATDDKSSEEIKTPILMYHSVLKNEGSRGKYVVSPSLFESDMRYLKDNGYTTVFVSELSDYVKSDKKLPEKPVVVTLDDGYYNNYVYVLPILEKYDMKASIAVVGKFTDIFSKEDSHNANYSHLTWDDIREITRSGRIEISNHTYDMHDTADRFGCFKKKSESDEEYGRALTADVLKLQKSLLENSGVECRVFTYPYGKIYNGSIPLIKEMGFSASLSCYEKMNYITKDENCLYLLGRFNRPSGTATEEFMRKNGI